MLIIPAIDLKENKVVRLLRGEFETPTIYPGTPEEFAKRWESEGAKYLHVIDLDGAEGGVSRNIPALKKILSVTRAKVQFGGGLRDKDKIKEILDLGVDRVILGTKALDKKLVGELAKDFGSHIAASLDVKGGMMQVEGWQRGTSIPVLDFAKELEGLGVKYAIYTDISRDGTLKGPNTAEFARLLKESKLKLILSGGVSSIEDIRNLLKYREENFYGVIAGRALYENKLSLKEAISLADKHNVKS